MIRMSQPEPQFLMLMDDTQRRIMNFQKELAVKKDRGVHKMEGIPGYAGGMGGMFF